MYQSKITEDEIKKLPSLKFEGPINLITSNYQVEQAVKELNKYECLGFDTETKPNFIKNRKNKVSLLQLSTEKEAFLFRLHYLTSYKLIFSLLANPNIKKIGVAISGDLKELKELSNFNPSGFIELQSYVKKFKIENIGLKKLGAIVLKGKISKRQQRSNWDLKTLSEAQLRYAATDAWASLMIYKKLRSSLS